MLLGGAGRRAVIVGEVEVGDAVVEGGVEHMRARSGSAFSPKLCQSPNEIGGSFRPLRPVWRYSRPLVAVARRQVGHGVSLR